jgi:predicted nucleotidyltransferase
MDKNTAFENVKKYIDFLNNNDFIICKAFVFGSYARGNFNENSDIDLALVMKNLKNSFTMQVELMKIGRKFDTRIEPHPFDEMDFEPSNPFANEILKSGIQIL